MTKDDRAKIFWSGRSQAVRLPREYRLTSDEVHIRRRGSAIILEPVQDDWGWLDRLPGKLDDDAVRSAREQPPVQERPRLRKLFR